jgi:hypothetical protein
VQDHHARPDPVECRGGAADDDLGVERPDVGHHEAEELLDCVRIVGELNPREQVRPHAEAELGVPHLLVSCGRDRHANGGLARGGAPRLIEFVDGKPSPEENRAEALSPVGGGVPRPRALSEAVPEHQWQPSRRAEPTSKALTVATYRGQRHNVRPLQRRLDGSIQILAHDVAT